MRQSDGQRLWSAKYQGPKKPGLYRYPLNIVFIQYTSNIQNIITIYLHISFSYEHALSRIFKNIIYCIVVPLKGTITDVVSKVVFLKSKGSPKVVRKNIVSRKLPKYIRCVSSVQNIENHLIRNTILYDINKLSISDLFQI